MRWGVRLQGYGAASYAEPAGSLPESVYRTNPDSNLTTGDYEDLDNLQLAVSGYRTTGPGQLSASAYYRRHRAERFNVNQANDPDNLGRSNNKIFGGTIDYRWQASGAVGVRIGAEGSTARTAVELFADSTKFGGAVAQTTYVKSPTWDVAGYALADYTVGRAVFSAGGRTTVFS